MANLDEADLILSRAQRLDDAVDAVTGHAEDRVAPNRLAYFYLHARCADGTRIAGTAYRLAG
jgi:hypothetical protein